MTMSCVKQRLVEIFSSVSETMPKSSEASDWLCYRRVYSWPRDTTSTHSISIGVPIEMFGNGQITFAVTELPTPWEACYRQMSYQGNGDQMYSRSQKKLMAIRLWGKNICVLVH